MTNYAALSTPALDDIYYACVFDHRFPEIQTRVLAAHPDADHRQLLIALATECDRVGLI